MVDISKASERARGESVDDQDDETSAIDVEAAAARAEGRDPDDDDGDGLISRASSRVRRAVEKAGERAERRDSPDLEAEFGVGGGGGEDLDDLFGQDADGGGVGQRRREDPFADMGAADDELPFDGADDDLDDLFDGGDDDDEVFL